MVIMKNVRHGIRTTYIKHGCRCKECVTANSTYLKKYRRDAQLRDENTSDYEYQKISRAALDWIILNQPDVYKKLKKGLTDG
jgi:hypothetical protein